MLEPVFFVQLTLLASHRFLAQSISQALDQSSGVTVVVENMVRQVR